MCKIQGKSEPAQNLTITLEVHEGEVEGRYSIEGIAQMPGFSFVVRTFMRLKQSQNVFYMLLICVTDNVTLLSDFV